MKTGTQILAIGTLSAYTGKPVLTIVVLALCFLPTTLPLEAVYAALDWHCADRTREEQARIQRIVVFLFGSMFSACRTPSGQ